MRRPAAVARAHETTPTCGLLAARRRPSTARAGLRPARFLERRGRAVWFGALELERRRRLREPLLAQIGERRREHAFARTVADRVAVLVGEQRRDPSEAESNGLPEQPRELERPRIVTARPLTGLAAFPEKRAG